MHTSIPLHIGMDVAKQELVAACVEGHFGVRKLRNPRSPLTAFLKGLPAGSRIAVEATGGDHERLAELAHRRGFIVYVLNPKERATLPRRWDDAARQIEWTLN